MGLTYLQQQRSPHPPLGELTKRILLEQGVPQGLVVSPYIFILAVELLLIKINKTKLIQGINYAQKESTVRLREVARDVEEKIDELFREDHEKALPAVEYSVFLSTVQQTLIEFTKPSVLDKDIGEYNFSFPELSDSEEKKKNSNSGDHSQNPGSNSEATRGQEGKPRGNSKRSQEVSLSKKKNQPRAHKLTPTTP